MTRRERIQTRVRRQRRLIGAAATLLVGTLLVVLPMTAFGKTPIEYRFVFEHTDGTTTVITGTSDGNTAFLPGAGGTDKDNPIGMYVHVSCSDSFPGGWGAKDGPDPVRDSEWRIQSYFIKKDSKTCGTATPTPPARPAIDIEKATNGHDADLPTGPRLVVGSTVTWTYVVTNTGNTPLTQVKVVDYVPTVGSATNAAVACPKTTLAVGEAMTCTMTGVAQLGQYANTAEVTAIGSTGTSVGSATGKKLYTFIFEHKDGTTTRIDGSSDKNDVFIPNAGGTSKTNPTGMTVHVSCSDRFPGGWGAKQGPSATADSEWRIAQFWIGEMKGGEVKTKCGSPIPNEITVRDQDPSHYIGVPADKPEIDIEKATNGEDADQAPGPRILEGNTVTWTYVVTNTGDTDLIDISVSDDKEGFIGTIAFLAPGQSTTLTHVGTAGIGQYANTGCVVGTSRAGVEVRDCDPSHYKGKDPYYEQPGTPAVDIEKATNGHDADQPKGPDIVVGATVTWTYVVTNTGDGDLWGIYVYDEREGRVTCPSRHLAPGASFTCTKTGTARAGQYANEAWVDAWGNDGTRVSDTDWSHYYGVVANEYDRDLGISLEKRFAGNDADNPPGVSLTAGSQVTVSYLVTNQGGEWLWGIFLYDEDYRAITCPQRSLAPGAAMTCSIQTTVKSGLNGNDAWVDAWAGDGTRVTANDEGWYTGH